MTNKTFRYLVVALVIVFSSGFQLHAKDTLPKAQRDMLHRRAVEVVIWGQPAEGIRGFIQATRRDLGGDWNDVVYFTEPMTTRHGFLTANNNVPYVVASLNTKDGPVVVDVPAASEKTKYFGSIIDAWQLPFADVGPTGDDKGKGAKYLLLPPGYEGTVPEGYLVYRPATFSTYIGFRPVSEKDGTLEEAVEYAQTLKIYPLDKADNPPETRFINAYPKKWDTLPRYDISYFHDLAAVVNEEPVQERDLAMMAMLESIGIKKGQPFEPDVEMTKILEAAVKDAYDYMQWYFVEGEGLIPFWKDGYWMQWNIPVSQAKIGFPFTTENRLLTDERAGGYYFFATFLPKKLGGGTFYLTGVRDSEGKLYNGKSTYRLNVPADTPAADFWSVIAYSMKTKGFFRDVKRVGLSSQDMKKMKVKDDGSVDIYFGPEAPQGMEPNWVPTPEDFMLLFRLYGPEKPLFEKTWKLPEMVKIK
jgi:hypothetical protein